MRSLVIGGSASTSRGSYGVPAVSMRAGRPAQNPPRVAAGNPPSRPARRIPPELYEAAAGRLVGADAGDSATAARRFVRSAAAHGIDLALMWGTTDESGKKDHKVRQVCLAVLGAGRTAVLFLSGPRASGGHADGMDALSERVAAIGAAVSWLAQEYPDQVRIAQSLPEPSEGWAAAALEGSGFQRVGSLAYLRSPLSRRREPAPETHWPEGITVRTLASGAKGHPDRALLAEALERSYEETLDCPGLCGMRETDDVIDSHLATGEFDPSLWWLLLLDGRPEGCALFNPCPEQNSVELVYLGLSKAVRGRGLAKQLLAHGMARVGGPGRVSVTCAVDRGNAPAIAVYTRAGFSEFSGRLAYVRAVP
jgi:mycothiol synthase